MQDLIDAVRARRALLFVGAGAYVFLGQANPVQAKVLESWGIVPLICECDDPGRGLQDLLMNRLNATKS